MNYEKILSIIILTWNGEDVIGENIKSLMKFFDGEKYELIVVDNDSRDKTKALLESFPEIKLIENKSNLGFAKGNNIGIDQASGKYILLLNQDVECIADAMGMMLDFLEKHSEYGAVAPQLLYPDGTVQKSCRPFFTWKFLLKDYLSMGRYKQNFYDHSKSQDVDQPMASVLMIRKSILDRIGNFDDHENYWLYFNDVDLSYRIHQAGYKHFLLTEAKFFHHHGQSGFKLNNAKRLWLYHKGLYYFFLKHYIKSRLSLKFGALGVFLVASYITMNIVKTAESFLKIVHNKIISEKH